MARYHDDPALRDRAPVFRDREAAGRHLAEMLEDYRGGETLVAAIPAGGVPVAAAIAARLELELDVLPVSKILLPWNTESGFGAVAFDGSVWKNEAAIGRLGLSDEAVAQSTAEAKAKVEGRIALLRHGRPLPALEGRSVVLVDDGIAAGSTMRAAVSALRRIAAEKVIVAVPTGHTTSLEIVASVADDLWCANVRGGFSFAVADAYESWHDVGDREAAKILKSFELKGAESSRRRRR